MKNIPLFVLLIIYGIPIEGPYDFLFELDILCCTHAYTNYAQKLDLFPTTLKGSTLKWFVVLGESTIVYWDDMKKGLRKYQSYC